MASNIGIKIANGEFYPLVEENSSIKKRLVLTTVHDNQPSVQVDLFRSPNNEMADAQYIGTVVLENIKPKPKGEPSIEMVISSDSDGNIIADAIDLETVNGEHYILTVSLKSLDVSRDGDIPDFEMESNEEPPVGLYQHAEQIRENKKSFPVWIIILIAVLLLLGVLGYWLFFMGGLNTVSSLFSKLTVTQTVKQEPVKEPVIQTPEPVIQVSEPVKEPVVQIPEPVTEPVIQAVEPPPVIRAPVTAPAAPSARPQRTGGRNPPVASYNVPATIPREGVNYRIRWGDTLWDISEAFYRDPWLYPRIARHNNISNPNLIISGRTVRVPPKN